MKNIDRKDFSHYYSCSKKQKEKCFETSIVHILSMDYAVEFEGLIVNGSPVWKYVGKEFGYVSYYPKANKIHLRRDNTWVSDGLNWIIENLIK